MQAEGAESQPPVPKPGRLSLGTLASAAALGDFSGPESQLGRRFTEQERVATLSKQGKWVRGWKCARQSVARVLRQGESTEY